MSAVEALLLNLFSQCTNSVGVIDSKVRWRKFCNKLNAAGILCSENDRAALEQLWAQHTIALRANTAATVGNRTQQRSRSSKSSTARSSNKLLAPANLNFPKFRQLIEQAFTPDFRADVERGFHRAAEIAKIWTADAATVPAELTTNKLRNLIAVFEETSQQIHNLRDTSASSFSLEEVSLGQLNDQFVRKSHCRRYQVQHGEEISRQLRIQRIPLQKMGNVLRSASRGRVGSRDIFGLMGTPSRRRSRYEPIPEWGSALPTSTRLELVQRGDDTFQIAIIPLHDYTAFHQASNCYAAYRQLTLSQYAIDCCGESSDVLPGVGVFAYLGITDPVRLSNVAAKVSYVRFNLPPFSKLHFHFVSVIVRPVVSNRLTMSSLSWAAIY